MKKLLVLSGKGGTGKTTVAASIIRLANVNAACDCDVDAPNLHIVNDFDGKREEKTFIGSHKTKIDETKCAGCGLCAKSCRFGALEKKGEIYQVNEYACEGCGVCTYVCNHDAVSLVEDAAGKQFLIKGDKVFATAKLKMGRGNSGKLVSAVKSQLFANAAEGERLAVIDGSPGIGCPVISSVSGVDLVLIVTEPSVSGLSDLERLVKTIKSFQTKAAVCVNRWDISAEQTEAIEKFCSENQVPFAGKIPYDKKAFEAVNNGKSLVEIECEAKKAIEEVYKNVEKLL